MHRRVYQVRVSKIDPSDYVQPYDVSDRLYYSVGADYVIDVEDRHEELKYLMESLKNVFVKGPEQFSFQIAEDGKEHFFKTGYERFRELCAQMTTLSLDAFIGKESGPEKKPMFLLMYELEEAYGSKYDNYVYEDGTLEPFSEWLRHADTDVTYYFGNVLDYHL
jgi:hypothetical protein